MFLKPERTQPRMKLGHGCRDKTVWIKKPHVSPVFLDPIFWSFSHIPFSPPDCSTLPKLLTTLRSKKTTSPQLLKSPEWALRLEAI